jgi:hypothetical protein
VCDEVSGSKVECSTAGNSGILKQFGLLDAVRAGSVPVGLGASAFTNSWWWFAGAAFYNVAGGPINNFLALVLTAAGDRLAHRLRYGRTGLSPPPGHDVEHAHCSCSLLEERRQCS